MRLLGAYPGWWGYARDRHAVHVGVPLRLSSSAVKVRHFVFFANFALKIKPQRLPGEIPASKRAERYAAISRRYDIRERSLATARLRICETRDSVSSMILPISCSFSSSK